MSDVLTASDSSIGSSGGTTEVKIMMLFGIITSSKPGSSQIWKKIGKL